MTSASSGPANVPDQDEITTNELFLICAALVGALIGLVILRFLVVLLIDVLILGDTASAKRSVLDLVDRVRGCCSCLSPGRSHRSSRGHDSDDDQLGSSNRNDQSDRDDIRRTRRRSDSRTALTTVTTTTATTTTANAPHTLDSCSIELGMLPRLRLNEILPSRTMTHDDWEKIMKEHTQEQQHQQHLRHSNSDTVDNISRTSETSVISESGAVTAVTCSICLQELRVGTLVCETEMCRHWFHANCIREWLVGTAPRHGDRRSNYNINYNNHCPNCRTRLVDPAILSRKSTMVEVERGLDTP